MNFVKNLMILAVLAAVGYGVYVSLSRNNIDPGPSPGVADAWPTGPKVELNGPKPASTPGGPLPLGGNTSIPPLPSTLPPQSLAPPLAIPSPSLAQSSGAASTATPYPSGVAAAQPSAPPLEVPSPSLSTSPAATPASPSAPGPLSGPADGLALSTNSIPSDVRNLTPPPATPTMPPAAPTQVESQLQSRFNAFIEDVQKYLDNGKFAEAHLALSMVYNNPNLPAEQAKLLVGLLDQLAGTVIYSRRHLLEPAYVVQQGDTLEKVALKYSIPWQLIAKINGLLPPNASNAEDVVKDQPLPLGMQLKVVRGPFDALIHLDKHELILMLPERTTGVGEARYAGRFTIGLGRDQMRIEGEYTVCNKILNPPYRGLDGIDIRPNDAKNPLGSAWIGLTDRVGIHGTNDPRSVGRDDNGGVICVGERDIQDLYGILSVGSRVKIVR